MNALAKILIRAYQLLITPLLGARCRFYPSCSAYALDAFNKRSFGEALKLTARRVSRCHPWNLGGVDMVPKAPPDK